MKGVTLPSAWNESFSFRVPAGDMPTERVRYVRSFVAQKAWKDKKVLVEFEGAGPATELWLNGVCLAVREGGGMPFGVDLTPYIKIGGTNRMEVTTTDWLGRVRLHVVDGLYQTLPLYGSLGTLGTYVYATNIDVERRSAVVYAESEVRNEGDAPRAVTFEMELYDRDGRSVDEYSTQTLVIPAGAQVKLKVGGPFSGLHLWDRANGYLYTVKTRIREGKKVVDEVATVTGFRKTQFTDGLLRINDDMVKLSGYSQTAGYGWPGLGTNVPEWLSDYSNGLVVEGGGHIMRWRDVCPSRQEMESCDRVGLLQAVPVGYAGRDADGDMWQRQLAMMRDAVVYNRNSPSVLYYELGLDGMSEEHVNDVRSICDKLDAHGGRAIASTRMLDNVAWDLSLSVSPMRMERGDRPSAEAGNPIYLSMGLMTRDCGMQADGLDVALIQVEVTDIEHRRCPISGKMIHFDIEGPIEWIGNEKPVAGSRDSGYDLPVEDGVVRVLVRSTGADGKAVVTASSKGVTSASYKFALNRKNIPLKGWVKE